MKEVEGVKEMDLRRGTLGGEKKDMVGDAVWWGDCDRIW